MIIPVTSLLVSFFATFEKIFKMRKMHIVELQLRRYLSQQYVLQYCILHSYLSVSHVTRKLVL